MTPTTAPKKLPGWVYGGVFGCLVIISWTSWNAHRADQKMKEAFGGESHFRCVKDAGRVYATRLAPAPGVNHPTGELHEFVASAEPFEISPDLSRRLKELLLSSASYEWDVTHTCKPLYGYRLRFACEGKSVEAWVCLECGLVEFVVDGKSVGGGIVTPVVRELKEVSIELFPGDLAIEDAAN